VCCVKHGKADFKFIFSVPDSIHKIKILEKNNRAGSVSSADISNLVPFEW